MGTTSKQISITRDQIRSTNIYEGLSKIMKDVVMNRVNVTCIQNGVNIALNVGLEKWEKENSFSNTNKEIVIELVKKHTK